MLSRRRAASWFMIPLLLLVCWLGARSLNADALWYDEWWSIYTSGGAHYGPLALDALLERAASQPWQPPAHYVLLAGWGAVAGWTPFALRAVSLFAGLLAMAAVFRLGRDMAARTDDQRLSGLVGLAAAAMIGSSAFFVFYLHEIRTYSLHALFTALTVWAYWNRLAPPQRRRFGPRGSAVAFALAAAGLLYTHYFGLLNLAALGLYHLLFAPRRDGWRWTLLLFVAAALLFLPWFIVSISQPPETRITDPVLREASLTPGQIIERLAFMFSNGGMALLAVLVWYGLRGRTRAAGLAAFWLVCVVGLAAAGNLLVHVLSEIRYLIQVWPVLAVLAALGVARMARRGISPALVIGAWVVVGVWSVFSATPLLVAFHAPGSDLYNNSYANAFRPLPWQQLYDTLAQRALPGDALALHRPDAVWAVEGLFDFYTHDLPVRGTILEQLPGRDQNNEYLPQAQQFIDGAPRVWLAIDQTMPPNFRLDAFRRALAPDYAACGPVLATPNLSLDLYARIPAPDTAPPGSFGDGIGFYLLEPLPASAADHLPLLLAWHVSAAVPANTYSVGLHVEDAGGQVVAQTDYSLPGSGYTCTPVTISLAGLPAADYRLLLMVYDWATGERLSGSWQDTSGDRLPVGSFNLR